MVDLFAMSPFIRGSSGRIERLVLKMPGVGVIYGVSKQMTGSSSGTGAGEGIPSRRDDGVASG
jgi:hypothetical protein